METRYIDFDVDFTEAKGRIRKKMRRNQDLMVHYQTKAEKVLENVTEKQESVSSSIGEEDTRTDYNRETDFSQFTDDFELNMEELEYDEINVPPKLLVSQKSRILKIQTSDADLLKAAEDKDWDDLDIEETEFQKIQRLIKPNDQVIDIVNCARLIGLELIGNVYFT